METRTEFTVPIPHLSLRHVSFSLSHLCDGSGGKPDPLFGFVVRGGARLVSEEGEMVLGERDFFYLPAHLRYRTEWRGSPDIEYYILSFSPAAPFPRFAPARIDALCGEATLRELRAIEASSGEGLRDRAAAAERFAALFAASLPYLSERAQKPRSRSLSDALEFILAHACENYPAAALSRAACLSESRLYHLFREEMGTSPLEYRNEVRIEKAAALLREGGEIRQVAAACGFESDISFRRVFKRLMGVTPGEWRRGTSG